jgi:hypothetical protein
MRGVTRIKSVVCTLLMTQSGCNILCSCQLAAKLTLP